MVKTMLMVLFICVSLFAEQPPPEVLQLINVALSGKDYFSDFDQWKVSMGFDSTTKISDVQAGDPIQRYWIIKDSLTKLNENTPVSKLMTPYASRLRQCQSDSCRLRQWDVPLLVKGKIINFFIIVKNHNHNGKWFIGGVGQDGGRKLARQWEKIKNNWPKTQGYNPVLVETEGRLCFHVPENDDSNLTYLKIVRRPIDSLENMTDTSYSTLTKSKDLLKYLKTPHAVSHITGGRFK